MESSAPTSRQEAGLKQYTLSIIHNTAVSNQSNPSHQAITIKSLRASNNDDWRVDDGRKDGGRRTADGERRISSMLNAVYSLLFWYFVFCILCFLFSMELSLNKWSLVTYDTALVYLMDCIRYRGMEASGHQDYHWYDMIWIFIRYSDRHQTYEDMDMRMEDEDLSIKVSQLSVITYVSPYQGSGSGSGSG